MKPRLLLLKLEKAREQHYEVQVEREKPWWKFIADLILSHLGLFILCILYAVAGAFIFIQLEKPGEEDAFRAKIARTKEIDSAVEYLKSIFWLYANDHDHYNFTRDSYREQIAKELRNLQYFTIDSFNDYNYDMTETWEYDWSFSKSLLFTITIITTIGYGHISPDTFEGKLFCIVYALIGIPLLLVFLNDIGAIMGDGVRWTYSRMCCRWCRMRRRETELPPGINPKNLGISTDEVGKEIYMPTDLVNVPIVVNLVIIFLFLLIGAIVFSSWEGWNLGPSFYFCFVTLTTIGFGDLVPTRAFLDAGESLSGTAKMVFTMGYVIFGIMLLSLALSLMQEQVMENVRSMAASIGMNSKKDEDKDAVTKLEKADLEEDDID